MPAQHHKATPLKRALNIVLSIVGVAPPPFGLSRRRRHTMTECQSQFDIDEVITIARFPRLTPSHLGEHSGEVEQSSALGQSPRRSKELRRQAALTTGVCHMRWLCIHPRAVGASLLFRRLTDRLSSKSHAARRPRPTLCSSALTASIREQMVTSSGSSLPLDRAYRCSNRTRSRCFGERRASV